MRLLGISRHLALLSSMVMFGVYRELRGVQRVAVTVSSSASPFTRRTVHDGTFWKIPSGLCSGDFMVAF